MTFAPLIIFAAIILVLLVLGFDKRGLPWYRKRDCENDLIQDPKLLEQAEAETRSISTENYVVAYSFDPIRPYSDRLMVELVNFLWENGIDAIYDQHPAPVGNLKSYTIKCPPDQAEEAKRLLDGRLQT